MFDSGFGSLSIIKAIQKRTRSDIIYFADQKNFPYGKKSKLKLYSIIKHTINNLQNKFQPDLIVIGSNTPSLLFTNLLSINDRVLGVLPPLTEAQQHTKTNSIAVLVTQSVAKSLAIKKFIKDNMIKKANILIIDVSDLVELVESGKFIDKHDLCMKRIVSILEKKFVNAHVDVATLSSTHLPFLLPLLQKAFPNILFLDPANNVATKICNHRLFFPSKKNTLTIFSSGDVKKFQSHLTKIRIRKTVHKLDF